MKTNAEYQRAWRLKNKERAKATQTAYQAANKDKFKAWREANQEKVVAYRERYVGRYAGRYKVREAEQYQAHKAEKNSKRLLKVYGLSPVEHEKLLLRSGNCCEICGEKEKESSRRLAIDHCHSTGVVRGLLCGACNRALGHVERREGWLKKAAEYLTKAKDICT